jgi:hypothetical protein
MSEDQQEEVVVVEEEQPKRKRAKRKVLVDVVIIREEGESALVQWVVPGLVKPGTDKKTDRLVRGFIEASKIERLAQVRGAQKIGKCDEDVLAAAQPYGVPWEKLIDIEHFNVTSQRIADELHRCGMWTVADIEADTNLAIRSLMSIVGPIIGVLHQRGRDYERFEKEDKEVG